PLLWQSRALIVALDSREACRGRPMDAIRADVKSIFGQAMALSSPEERAAYLQEACADDPELRAEIESLLQADRDAGSFLGERTPCRVAAYSGAAAAQEPPGVRPALAQLGDFRIIREIGRGGMGVVYEAEQVSLGRHVALKVLPAQALRDDRQRRRFEREAKAAAKLHHTNIVPVYGVGEHEGTPYYVMQFIQGLGLDEVILELSRMQSGGTAAAAPTSTRRSQSARLAAQSLMTGQFRAGSNGAHNQAAVAPTIDGPAAAGLCEAGQGSQVAEPASQRPATEEPKLETPISGSGHGVAARRTDASGMASSVSLPGQSESVSGRKSRKLSYWQSVARAGVPGAHAL